MCTVWGLIQDLNIDHLTNGSKTIHVIDMIIDNDKWLDFPATLTNKGILVAGVLWKETEE